MCLERYCKYNGRCNGVYGYSEWILYNYNKYYNFVSIRKKHFLVKNTGVVKVFNVKHVFNI